MVNSEKKIRRSQLPYKIATDSIGDIMRAKAENGDRNAQMALKKLIGKKKFAGKNHSVNN